MRFRKNKIFVLIGIIVISTFVVNPIQAQTGDEISTFGVEIKKRSTFTFVDGGVDEPDNHWVHYNGLEWSRVEEEEGNRDWNLYYVTNMKKELKAMIDEGLLEVVLIIRSTPLWAQKYEGRYCGPMQEQYIDDFADFVVEAVQEFDFIKYFEIWNEPDSPYWVGDPESQYGCWGNNSYEDFGGGKYYGEVLKKVYEKVREVKNPNEVKILNGGLLLGVDPFEPEYTHSRAYNNFFEGILNACQSETCFDIVNFHGYNYYNPYVNMIRMERDNPDWHHWNTTGGQVEGKLKYLLNLMDQYQVEKPIFMTEAALLDYEYSGRPEGYVENYDPIFEITKADYVIWLYTRNLTLPIDATFWFRLDNYGWNQSGLLNTDNDPLAAYDTYRGVTEALAGLSHDDFQKNINPGLGVHGFEFLRDDGKQLWVLFTSIASEISIQVGEGTEVYDHNYNLVSVPGDGVINFSRPIYVVFDETSPPEFLQISNFYLPLITQ